MCTIITITRDLYTSEAIETIISDSLSNFDGWSLLLTNTDGELITSIRTLNIDTLWGLLDLEPWGRMFLHARYATGGSEVNLANTHGWESNGVFYMHNGCIQSKQAARLPVDSLQIGKWLSMDLTYALDRLYDESFANVFFIDPADGTYWVHRSSHNTLFTDGCGNYSTNAFGMVTLPVEKYSQSEHDLFDFGYCEPELEEESA